MKFASSMTAVILMMACMMGVNASHTRSFVVTHQILEETRTDTEVVVEFRQTGTILSVFECPPQEGVDQFFDLPLLGFTIEGGVPNEAPSGICKLDAYECGESSSLRQCTAVWNVTLPLTQPSYDWSYGGCCRVAIYNDGTDQNGAFINSTGDGSTTAVADTDLSGIVYVDGSNNANPITAQQPVVRLCETDGDEITSFQVTGIDAEDGFNVTYSYADGQASGVYPPPFLSINSTTGVVSGSTTGRVGLWAMQVIIADQGGSVTPVDFLIDIGGSCSEISNPSFLTGVDSITLTESQIPVDNVYSNVQLEVSCDGGEVELYIAAEGFTGTDVAIGLEAFTGGVLPGWLTATNGIPIEEREDATSDVLLLSGTRTREYEDSEFFCFVVQTVEDVPQQSFGSLCVAIDACGAPPTIPSPTASPTPAPTLEPCPYDGNDGNLEVLNPPLLDENNTRVFFINGSQSIMQAHILVPRQYTTVAFEFAGAVNESASYDSRDTADGANSFWTVDYVSDLCNIVYTANIPWHDFRTHLGGVHQTEFLGEVVYDAQLNIEVTKLIEVSPFEHSGGPIVHERVVTMSIPFQVKFDLEVELEATVTIRGEDDDDDNTPDTLRLTAALLRTSSVTVDPNADPVMATGSIEFVTYIPMPLYLNESSIDVDADLLRNELEIVELTDRSVCEDVQAEFCIQYWRVDLEPLQCTLNGEFAATMRAACHPGAQNCNPPVPDEAVVVMDVTSDNFCGVTQEVNIEGTLSLETTNCNGNLTGLVQVSSPEGGIISSAEIITVRTAPALLNSMYVVVYEEEAVPVVSILNFEQTLVEADEIEFAFLWDGDLLRCDVEATVELVVRVEYGVPPGGTGGEDDNGGEDNGSDDVGDNGPVLLTISNKPNNKRASGAKSLLAEQESVTFQSRVQIFPADVVAGDGGATASSASTVARSAAAGLALLVAAIAASC